MSRSIPSWIRTLDRFLVDVCSQLGAADYEKSSPRCSQSTIFEKSPFQVDMIFDAILVPTWFRFGTKFHQNLFKNRFKETTRKWSIFESIFWASWFDFEDQVGTQEPLKAVSKRFQDVLKTSPRPLKSNKNTQDQIFDDFWYQNPMGTSSPTSMFEVWEFILVKFLVPSLQRILVDFFFQLWLPDLDFSNLRCKGCRESKSYQESFFEVNIDFWFHFGASLASFWHQKSIKIHPKIDHKRHQKNDGLLNRCFEHLACILGTKLRSKSFPKP